MRPPVWPPQSALPATSTKNACTKPTLGEEDRRPACTHHSSAVFSSPSAPLSSRSRKVGPTGWVRSSVSPSSSSASTQYTSPSLATSLIAIPSCVFSLDGSDLPAHSHHSIPLIHFKRSMRPVLSRGSLSVAMRRLLPCRFSPNVSVEFHDQPALPWRPNIHKSALAAADH